MKTIEVRPELFKVQTSDRIVAAHYTDDGIYKQSKASELIIHGSSVIIAWTAICKAMNSSVGDK